ncbi:MAG: hypothetical protein R3C26_21250 [Calditrichia bacterium]
MSTHLFCRTLRRKCRWWKKASIICVQLNASAPRRLPVNVQRYDYRGEHGLGVPATVPQSVLTISSTTTKRAVFPSEITMINGT